MNAGGVNLKKKVILEGSGGMFPRKILTGMSSKLAKNAS